MNHLTVVLLFQRPSVSHQDGRHGPCLRVAAGAGGGREGPLEGPEAGARRGAKKVRVTQNMVGVSTYFHT